MKVAVGKEQLKNRKDIMEDLSFHMLMGNLKL